MTQESGKEGRRERDRHEAGPAIFTEKEERMNAEQEALDRQFPEFMYGAFGQERMTAVTVDEAAEEIIDQMDLLQCSRTVTVVKHRRKRLVPEDFQDKGPLSRFLEELDEEYGDPDGSPWDPSPAMLAAEREFLARVLREYRPFKLDPVQEIEVGVFQWVDENARRWLHEGVAEQESGSRGLSQGETGREHPEEKDIR